MAIASGTRVQLRYLEEVTHGTTPDTPTLKQLRATSRNINLKKNMLNSAEVWPHRQVTDMRHGFQSIQGSIACELCDTAHDELMPWILGGAWSSDVIKVGTSINTLTIERAFLDLAQYQHFRGVAAAQATIRIAPESLVTCEVGVVGMTSSGFTGTPLTVSPTAASSVAPFSSFDGSIDLDGSPIAVVTGLDFTINNNRGVQAVVGAYTSPDVFEGQSIITGNMSLFFESVDAYEMFEDEDEVSLETVLTNPFTAATWTFLFPRLKYTASDIDPPQSGPIIISQPFQALYDGSEATTMKLTRA